MVCVCGGGGRGECVLEIVLLDNPDSLTSSSFSSLLLGVRWRLYLRDVRRALIS